MREWVEKQVHGLRVEVAYQVSAGASARRAPHGLARPADGVEVEILSVSALHPGWDDGLPRLDFSADAPDEQVLRLARLLAGKSVGDPLDEGETLAVLAVLGGREPYGYLGELVAEATGCGHGRSMRPF